MDISVLICTYNRAESLRQTLSTFEALEIPAGVQWELMVVDNNSNDHTSQVCGQFKDKLPLTYDFEERQGKSFALNRALRNTTGDLILFTDDDVNVDPTWIREMWRAGKAHPEAAFFGGKVLPQWEEAPPEWIMTYSKGMLSGLTLDFNLGEREVPVRRKNVFPGANMAFRREAVVKTGAFREDLGVIGKSRLGHEETEYMYRLLDAGYRGLYVPQIVVYHRNPRHRMTERYLFHWFAGCGRSDVRMGGVWPEGIKWFGAPRYLWRRLVSNAFSYVTRRWNPAARATWVPAAVRMAAAWGAILEFRRIGAEGGRKD